MNKYKILPLINSPKDLKKLNNKEKNKLSHEISMYIDEVVSQLGGHYSSPLGVVDLTLALHSVYDVPNDKIIWDVGHQTYAHKIITGRRDAFKKLRQYKGISGFLKIEESKYDIFGAGHASTSISAALGFAHARDNMKKQNQIVAVIGDGALTGGMAYEGLNNLGFHRTQLTVVLNDNSFSISKSVGALSKYLTRITTNPTYNKLRNEIWNISNKLPAISEHVKKILRKTEGTVKNYLTPGILFEELGLRYIGPIDGHDIKNMIKIFKAVKLMNTPVLLHVFTDKSRSVKSNNHDAVKSYSLSPKKTFNVGIKKTFSSVLGESLNHLVKDYNFKCVTAAMEIGTGLKIFSDKYKNKYIDVGIAEEHAITYAAGLSAAGIIPVIPIYSTFMQRGYDQIIHDFALQNLPGIFCMDRAGIVGYDGPTHHGVFDISFMRSIPNIVVSAPKDGYELHDLIYTGLKNKSLMSIRYPKERTNYRSNYKPKEIKIGTWEILQKGEYLCILTFGSMIETSLQVADYFKNNKKIFITVVNCRYIKPFDKKMLNKLINKHEVFICIEEGIISGGFGTGILEYFSSISIRKNVKLLGISDEFTEHGSRSKLLENVKLSYKTLINSINIIINEKK